MKKIIINLLISYVLFLPSMGSNLEEQEIFFINNNNSELVYGLEEDDREKLVRYLNSNIFKSSRNMDALALGIEKKNSIKNNLSNENITHDQILNSMAHYVYEKYFRMPAITEYRNNQLNSPEYDDPAFMLTFMSFEPILEVFKIQTRDFSLEILIKRLLSNIVLHVYNLQKYKQDFFITFMEEITVFSPKNTTNFMVNSNYIIFTKKELSDLNLFFSMAFNDDEEICDNYSQEEKEHFIFFKRINKFILDFIQNIGMSDNNNFLPFILDGFLYSVVNPLPGKEELPLSCGQIILQSLKEKATELLERDESKPFINQSFKKKDIEFDDVYEVLNLLTAYLNNLPSSKKLSEFSYLWDDFIKDFPQETENAPLVFLLMAENALWHQVQALRTFNKNFDQMGNLFDLRKALRLKKREKLKNQFIQFDSQIHKNPQEKKKYKDALEVLRRKIGKKSVDDILLLLDQSKTAKQYLNMGNLFAAEKILREQIEKNRQNSPKKKKKRRRKRKNNKTIITTKNDEQEQYQEEHGEVNEYLRGGNLQFYTKLPNGIYLSPSGKHVLPQKKIKQNDAGFKPSKETWAKGVGLKYLQENKYWDGSEISKYILNNLPKEFINNIRPAEELATQEKFILINKIANDEHGKIISENTNSDIKLNKNFNVDERSEVVLENACDDLESGKKYPLPFLSSGDLIAWMDKDLYIINENRRYIDPILEYVYSQYGIPFNYFDALNQLILNYNFALSYFNNNSDRILNKNEDDKVYRDLFENYNNFINGCFCYGFPVVFNGNYYGGTASDFFLADRWEIKKDNNLE